MSVERNLELCRDHDAKHKYCQSCGRCEASLSPWTGKPMEMVAVEHGGYECRTCNGTLTQSKYAKDLQRAIDAGPGMRPKQWWQIWR